MNSVTGLNLCRFLLIVFINCFHFVYSRNLSKEGGSYNLYFWGFFFGFFYAVSTVFQLFNGDSSQIHVSWTTFNQYLTSPLS